MLRGSRLGWAGSQSQPVLTLPAEPRGPRPSLVKWAFLGLASVPFWCSVSGAINCLSFNNRSQNIHCVRLWPGPTPPGPVSQASFCIAPALLSLLPGGHGDPHRPACLHCGCQAEPPPPRPPAQESHFLLSRHISCWSCCVFFFFFGAPDLFLHPFWVTFVVTGLGGGGRA